MGQLIIKKGFLLAIALILSLGMVLKVQAQQRDALIVIYASWSVVSRDLRPVAANIAQAYKLPYVEYDVDDPGILDNLNTLNIAVPTQTPFVVVIKGGKIIFRKAYPNSTPDLMKEDLSSALAKNI